MNLSGLRIHMARHLDALYDNASAVSAVGIMPTRFTSPAMSTMPA
jgi:hypothetical protein